MSSDHITGIAILDRTMTPQRLACLCRSHGKPDLIEVIPVYEKGSQKPQTRNGAAWCYEVRGDRLFFTPSLHIRYQNPLTLEWRDRFHNGYAWDVQFLEAGPNDSDPKFPERHLYEMVRKANA